MRLTYAGVVFVTCQVALIAGGEIFSRRGRVELVVVSRSTSCFYSESDGDHVFCSRFYIAK